MVKALVKSDADVRVKNNEGTWPHHLAAKNGQVDALQYLLDQG